jgi:hypothetical protein
MNMQLPWRVGYCGVLVALMLAAQPTDGRYRLWRAGCAAGASPPAVLGFAPMRATQPRVIIYERGDRAQRIIVITPVARDALT